MNAANGVPVAARHRLRIVAQAFVNTGIGAVMTTDRREFLQLALAGAATTALGVRQGYAQERRGPSIEAHDRVFLTNEDSNTVSVIDPKTNAVETTINLTSFDEDPRPPFRFVTAGIVPTHAAMIHKPLYH